MENANDEEVAGTPDYTTNASKPQVDPSKDTDLVEIVLYWPKEMAVNGTLQLAAVGMQVASKEYGLRLQAFCLMPNHYHLLVETPRANLSRAIGWLQTTYTIRFNRRHRRSGHLGERGRPLNIDAATVAA